MGQRATKTCGFQRVRVTLPVLVAGTTLVGSLACAPVRDSGAARAPASPPGSTTPPRKAVEPAVVATTEPENGASASEAPLRAEFIADGTLIVVGSETLVARAQDGALHRTRLPNGGASVIMSPDHVGVVVVKDDSAMLLLTPELRTGYDGTGKALMDAPAIALPEHHALVLQLGTRSVRLDTSPAGSGEVEAITMLAGGTRLSLTAVAMEADGSERVNALLYNAEHGQIVGPGLPFRSSYPRAPRAGQAGKVGYSTEGSSVLRWDLETATVTKKAALRCPANQDLGNPISAEGAALLVVTCGDDGIVLDATTLAIRRKIPRIVPGCDQGPILPGVLQSDGRTLVLEACGGSAKLDLSSGKYACADDPGLLGAPYLDGLPPGALAGPRVPAGREKVGPCRSATSGGEMESAHPLGASRRYQVIYGTKIRVSHAGGSTELEADSQLPTLSPDETRLAYVRADRVVVRSLPDGRLLQEIRVYAP